MCSSASTLALRYFEKKLKRRGSKNKEDHGMCRYRGGGGGGAGEGCGVLPEVTREARALSLSLSLNLQEDLEDVVEVLCCLGDEDDRLPAHTC